MDKKHYKYLIPVVLIVGLILFSIIFRLFVERQELRLSQNELDQKMDQLQSQLNRLESAQGNNYVNAQKIPLPVIFCGDTLDMDNHFIRERVEREFYSLLGNQGQLQLYLKRTEKYLPMIEEHLRNSGLPEDLKYLSVHESALLPSIRSRSNAVGLWQFMYHTGRMYKLKINRYVDERRDPQKATMAAMRFIKDLHKRFENWPLVLAAYNGGQGRIQRSIKKQNSNSLIDLSLPQETERYYFKIVGTKIIISDPEMFGFKLEGIDFFPVTATEEIVFVIEESSMTLEEIASEFDLSLVALKEYNPQLINTHLIKGSHQLKIPVVNHAAYLERTSALEHQIISHQDKTKNDMSETELADAEGSR
jgi:hypothetical protein